MMEKLKTMDEELLEAERWIDDDYLMINQFYNAKRMYPNIPFYLQDAMRDVANTVEHLIEDGYDGEIEDNGRRVARSRTVD